MSVLVSGPAWVSTVTDAVDLLVLLALADQANDDGWAIIRVWKLARKCRLSDRQVRRSIATLAEQGHIEIQQRRGMSSVYRVKPIVTPDSQSWVRARDRRDAAEDSLEPEKVAARGASPRSLRTDGENAAGAGAASAARSVSRLTPDSQSGVCGLVIHTHDSQSSPPDSQSAPPLTNSHPPLTNSHPFPSSSPSISIPSSSPGGRDKKNSTARRGTATVDDREAPTPEELERRRAEQLARIRAAGVEV